MQLNYKVISWKQKDTGYFRCVLSILREKKGNLYSMSLLEDYNVYHFWRGRGIGSNYENYWLDLIRHTVKSYRIVNQLFTAIGFEDNILTA